MRDREKAIHAIMELLGEQTWAHRNLAENVIDAYEALPVVVTDEMVERAALAFYRPASLGWAAPPLLLRNIRAALEAALGGETT